MDSVVLTHGLSCSVACGIFLDQGLNWYPLHWQADSFFFFFFNTEHYIQYPVINHNGKEYEKDTYVFV